MMQILMRLEQQPEGLNNRELCQLLEVQPNHLWKLLVNLERMGLVRRQRGQVFPTAWAAAGRRSTRFETALSASLATRSQLARYAAQELIASTDQVLAMDSGATSRLVLQELHGQRRRCKIFTNNVELGHSELLGGGIALELLGGHLDPDSRATVAGICQDPSRALAQLNDEIAVDLSVVVPLSLSWADDGSLVLWTLEPDEIPVRSALLRIGARLLLLASSDRLGPKGMAFGVLGQREGALRPLDERVTIACAATEAGQAPAEAFLARAREAGLQAHLVRHDDDHSEPEER
ncbi:MAG: hypothetical protein ABIO70_08455 [Pseudomonadota bacterium]